MPDLAGESEGAARTPRARGERTRARLLDATLALIARRGVGAFTTRDVVREAESSLGVLTYHFPSRRDLLAAALARHLEKQDGQGADLAAHSSGPVSGLDVDPDLDALTDRVIDLLSHMVHTERDVFVAGHELDLEALRDPALAAQVRPARSTHRDAIERLLRDAGSDAPDLDAELLAATFQGLGLKWLGHAGDRDYEARLRRAVRRLIERFFPVESDARAASEANR